MIAVIITALDLEMIMIASVLAALRPKCTNSEEIRAMTPDLMTVDTLLQDMKNALLAHLALEDTNPIPTAPVKRLLPTSHLDRTLLLLLISVPEIIIVDHHHHHVVLARTAADNLETSTEVNPNEAEVAIVVEEVHNWLLSESSCKATVLPLQN